MSISFFYYDIERIFVPLNKWAEQFLKLILQRLNSTSTAKSHGDLGESRTPNRLPSIRACPSPLDHHGKSLHELPANTCSRTARPQQRETPSLCVIPLIRVVLSCSLSSRYTAITWKNGEQVIHSTEQSKDSACLVRARSVACDCKPIFAWSHYLKDLGKSEYECWSEQNIWSKTLDMHVHIIST